MPADSNPFERSQQRLILFVTTLASFISPYISSSINIALPSIGAEFGAGAVILGWIPTVYILTSAILLVPFGRLADIYGLKRIFSYGTLIFTIAAALCGFSTSSAMLIALQVLQGVGGAMIYATAVAMLIRAYHVRERGRVLGINVAAVYTGLSAGPFLGGILTETLGWRSIFFAIVPIGALIAFITLTKPADKIVRNEGETFDTTGSIIYGLMLFALIYGLSVLPSKTGIALIGLSGVGFVIFIHREIRIPNPVLNIRLFADNPTFTLSNIAALINYSSTAAVAFLLSLYLQYNRGLDPMTAGTILVAQPVVMAVLSPAAGKLSDRIEPGVVASCGMAVTTVCLFLFSLLTEGTPVLMISVILMLLGFGYALFSSPNTNAIMSSVEPQYYGIASGAMGTMRLIGQMLSMGIALMIFSIFIGHVRINAAVHTQLLDSISLLFTIFSAICLFGVFCSLGRGKVRKNEE